MKIYYREDYTSPVLGKLFPLHEDILILRDFIYSTKEEKALVTTNNIEYHSIFESFIKDLPSGLVSLNHENILQNKFYHEQKLFDIRKENYLPRVYIVDRPKALEILEKYDCRLQRVREEIYCSIPPLAYPIL
jgi:hypothetical protein